MNILSLFDGMSCGRIALERAGVEVDNYFASEVDKYAIKVTMANYPDTIQLGDVRNVRAVDLPKIDLLIGGSPCQGFSQAGKGGKFDDPRSALFWEYVRILKECRKRNPDILFLLENVCMDKYSEGVISDALELDPVMINSALVSAQNRERLYWSNIRTEVHTMFGHKRTTIPQPEDRGILLKDILETSGTGAIKNLGEIQERNKKAMNLDANYWKGIDNHGQRAAVREHILSDAAMARIARKKYSKPQIMPDKTGTLNCKNNSGQLSMDSGTTLIPVITGGAMRGRYNPDGTTSQQLEINDLEKANSLTTVGKDSLCIQIGKADLNGHDYVKRVYSPEGKGPSLVTGTGGNHEPKVGIIEKHESKDGLICVGGLLKNKKWLEDGKTLQRNFSQGERIYSTEGKAPTLSAQSGGTAGAGSALVVEPKVGVRKSEKMHRRRLDRTKSLDQKADALLATSWKGMAANGCTNIVDQFTHWRKLTPLECERLQTVPDNYTNHVSNTQRYKMLGNGWTVDVIAHIFSFLPEKFFRSENEK